MLLSWHPAGWWAPMVHSRLRHVLRKGLRGEFWKGLPFTWKGIVGGGWLLHRLTQDQNKTLFWQMFFGNQNLRVFINDPLAIYQGRQTGHPSAGACNIQFWKKETDMVDNAHGLLKNLGCRGNLYEVGEKAKGLCISALVKVTLTVSTQV